MEPLRPSDPPSVGPYRLTSRLRTTGTGPLYMARTAARRKLVIKVVRSELAQDQDFRARFAREADAARRVDGDHNAQVVDADPDAEAPWIATAHIPGPTLGQAIHDHGPITPPALHDLAAGLTEGLKALHACGLTRHGLEPDNIVLTGDGPRITGFGIARPLNGGGTTTHGAVLDPLSYLAPEQTDASLFGPASDVFSLGTVLVFTATGTNPFAGATETDTLHRLNSSTPDPGDLDPHIRSLILQCWNHDPGRRPTPDQVLAHLAAHDPHSSTPPPQASRSETPSGPSPESTAEPSTETVSDLRHASVQHPPQAPPSAIPPQPPTPAARAGSGPGRQARRYRKGVYVSAAIAVVIVLALFLWNALISATVTVIDHGSVVGAVAFSPDGTTLATGSWDGTVRLWDTETEETITILEGHNGWVTSVAFGPDGATLATGGHDGTVRLWDTATGETIAILDTERRVQAVAFSPDGTTLATGGHGRTARLWDIATGETITTLEGHTQIVQSVAFSPDGDLLATGGGETARLWDIATGETITTLEGHTQFVESVEFSPDGTTLATGSWDLTARLWNVETGETITTVKGHHGFVMSVAFSPDGDLLATGSGDTARLWDIATGETITTLEGHTQIVQSVAFSPDGDLLATGDGDTARLWSLN